MIQPETPEEKRLPRQAAQAGEDKPACAAYRHFLILFIPLMLINNQQPAKQTELKATLVNLEKILAAEETPKAKLEAELAQINAETEAAEAIFPNTSQSPEILDSLFELAELNDIYADQGITSHRNIVVLTIQIGLKGQVPKFQNLA